MDQPSLPTTTTFDALSPRRLASIRRLIASGITILALLAISDLVMLDERVGLAWFRAALIALMSGLWWATRGVRTSAALAAIVYLELLLMAVASSVSLFFDHSRLTAPLDTMMLVIVLSGSAWPTLRHFITGTLVCVLPMLFALATAGVDPAVWAHYTIYLGASVLVAFALWRQRVLAARASTRLRAELVRRASEDAMTGVLNRAGWNLQAPRVLAAAEANDQPVALLYLDLDHFKSINDRHGHAVGDAVIEHAARLIRDEVREHDVVARLGGEEFAVLLTGAGASRAPAVAERIRDDFENRSSPAPCSLCVGVADRLPGESLKALMGRADAALLRAKRNGRNRVEQADVPA